MMWRLVFAVTFLCVTAGEAAAPMVTPDAFARWAASRGFVVGVGTTTQDGTFVVDRLRYSSNGPEIVVRILLRRM